MCPLMFGNKIDSLHLHIYWYFFFLTLFSGEHQSHENDAKHFHVPHADSSLKFFSKQAVLVV